MGKVTNTRFSAKVVFSAAFLLRVGLLLYGLLQDAYSPMKYTDIDYFVFTDAARFVSHGQSPYERDTYRYTPLLAWSLLPCTWYSWSFSFGKSLFAIGDIFAGWLIIRILRLSYGMPQERALKFASIWLLNPMVATISTRGSSEGLLGVMVVALLWAVTQRKITLAGILLGLAVHFKIYPFVYGFSILWWLDGNRGILLGGRRSVEAVSSAGKPTTFLNPARFKFGLISLLTFFILNWTMYMMFVASQNQSIVQICCTDTRCRYGSPFIKHTYLHHLTRIDHRHNFSVYNTLLHLKSSSPSSVSKYRFESLAFIPQLFLSALLIPITLAKKDLASTMLAQTFAFVTFNKVCTSQVGSPNQAVTHVFC